MLKPLITKINTNMRENRFPNERLVHTLRYLATGRTFENLKYSAAFATTTIT